ncbi:MAG: hypothetical protein ACI89U_000534, partial [Gammaproteobacteria bacterium]
ALIGIARCSCRNLADSLKVIERLEVGVSCLTYVNNV